MMPLEARTSRAARRLRHVTLAIIALYELVILFSAWVLATGRRGDFPALQIHDDGMAPGPAAVSLLVIGLLVGIALFRLARMLRKVEGGMSFAAASDLRGFAFYLLLAVIATILATPLAQIWAVVAGGGAGRIGFSFGSSELLTLLVTSLLFLVARLLDEAQRVADDASQIV